MIIHEFGKENDKHIVLIHPSLTQWDYFEYVIPYLEKDYHLIVPTLPGYSKGTEFTSVEDIAWNLTDWLTENDYSEIDCLYGCSMGGAVVARMIADNRVNIKSAVLDGGITPYQLPWIITRLIAVKDFCMISIGKIGGIRLLEKAFATDEYSKEDLQYIADIFKWLSFKTIWRTFESCNNYQMPSRLVTPCKRIHYWYGDKEIRERKLDLKYMKDNFNQVIFEQMDNLGHAGMALERPEEFSQRIKSIVEEI